MEDPLVSRHRGQLLLMGLTPSLIPFAIMACSFLIAAGLRSLVEAQLPWIGWPLSGTQASEGIFFSQLLIGAK